MNVELDDFKWKPRETIVEVQESTPAPFETNGGPKKIEAAAIDGKSKWEDRNVPQATMATTRVRTTGAAGSRRV